MTWQFIKTGFTPEQQALEESLFSLGNGYIGVRGSLEEFSDYPDEIRGTYINGLYARVPMQHAEMAYGLPTMQDKQPRIVDTQSTNIWLDGESLQLNPKRLSNYERALSFNQGQTIRTYTYHCANGKTAQLRFERIVSLVIPECLSYRLEIVYDGQILVETMVEGDVENYVNPKDPRVGSGHSKLLEYRASEVTANGGSMLLSVISTGLLQATAVEVYGTSKQQPISFDAKRTGERISWQATAFGELKLEKRCAFTDSLRHADCLEMARVLVKRSDFNALSALQEAYLTAYWETYGIEIEGCEQDQQAMRFMQFQLIQALGRDAYANMAAKGLSGEGYEGHYFWDTEIYGIPAAMWSLPERSRALLSYRHRLLPMAKERARELGHLRGAAYPWRTISGIESSGYFPAGTAQYHINADIAYASIQYHLAHEDWDFTRDVLFELVYETALIWLEVGHRHGDGFRICAVTGPDEYTAIVNNNYYTNTMAKYHLNAVGWLYDALIERYGEDFKRVWQGRLTQDIMEAMQWASSHMYLPVDTELNLAKQDDAFLEKPLWPFDSPEFQRRPLLLHYHPLTIYRYQVLKQADAVLAHLLYEDNATELLMANTFSYYERLTTHDSSLSACIYGMMAARLGNPIKAYRYFQESLALDLEDTHGNTRDGLHLANIAGSVLSVYKGFCGLRLKPKALHLRPMLPGPWQGYRFGVNYRGGKLFIAINREDDAIVTTLRYEGLEGEQIRLMIHFGEACHEISLASGMSQVIKRPIVNRGIALQGKVYYGVAFDMDGVLAETSHWHYIAWRDLARRLDFDLPEQFEDQLRGVSRQAALEMVLSHGGVGDSMTLEQKKALAEWKNARYLDYIKALTPKDRMLGVTSVLMSLRARGVKIALASASENAPLLLRAMGLEGYFDVVVDPSRIENPKPAPDIFIEACKGLKLDVEACVGIEDAAAGIRSICQAGLYAVGIGSDALLGEAHAIYPNLEVFYREVLASEDK